MADRKGNVLGLGAPPAKEMRDGGERCCNSALWDTKETKHKNELDLQGTPNNMGKKQLKWKTCVQIHACNYSIQIW